MITDAPCAKWGIPIPTPIKSTNPAIHDTQIDDTMPLGPEIAALWVSSVTCAEASYPVKV